MDVVELLIGLAVYVAAARVIVWKMRGAAGDVLFAMLNIVAVYLLFFPFGYLALAAVLVAYIGLAVGQYIVLRAGGSSIAAFGVPIIALIAIKTVPHVLDPSFALPTGDQVLPMLAALIGISYFAFRTSYLALEVRNGIVAMPSLWQYLGFCFFAPTMAVGPINRYSNFQRSRDAPRSRSEVPLTQAGMRLLLGAVKYRFIAGMLDQLTYAGLLMDGHPHHWIDLAIAGVAYYLYLYCNFSGFCDMAIGAAGLIGIYVEENFHNPFAARNVRDFWNRWHITLSAYMRDVVFTPLSKQLVGVVGPAGANHAAAFSITTVFLLIGVWHGLSWNFVAFGAMHAVGVVTAHYYTIWLKKWLGRDGFSAYNKSCAIHAVAIAVTFVYVTSSFLFFANDFADIRQIMAAVNW